MKTHCTDNCKQMLMYLMDVYTEEEYFSKDVFNVAMSVIEESYNVENLICGSVTSGDDNLVLTWENEKGRVIVYVIDQPVFSPKCKISWKIGEEREIREWSSLLLWEKLEELI